MTDERKVSGTVAQLVFQIEKYGQLETLMGLIEQLTWSGSAHEDYLTLGRLMLFFDQFSNDNELMTDIGRRMDQTWARLSEDQRDTVPSDIILQRHAVKESNG